MEEIIVEMNDLIQKYFGMFKFIDKPTQISISSIVGVTLPQDYIEFMQKYNGGEGSVGKEAWLILFPLEELDEINEDYCIDEFLPNHCIIGSSGGGELFGVDTYGNYYAVPAVSMSEEDRIDLGNTFVKFIQNLDTYLD
jgi:hypothetical protein